MQAWRTKLCDNAICLLPGHGKLQRTKLEMITYLVVGRVVKDLVEGQASQVHGNLGREPPNATPQEYSNSAIVLLKRIQLIPTWNVLNVTQASELGGIATLANEILASIPVDMERRAMITIIRFIKKHCRKRGLRGLSVRNPEHNACPHCAGDRFKVAEAAGKRCTHRE